MAKLTTEAIRCDRCGRMDVPPASPSADYTGPRSYTLIDHELRGGPVLDLCKSCRVRVEEFARGVG